MSFLKYGDQDCKQNEMRSDIKSCRHYKSIFNHCDVFGQQSNRIRWKTQNKGYYAVQGHSRSSRSVPIESPYATSLGLIVSFLVTDNLSHTLRSYRSLLFKFWTLNFWATLWGLRDNVRFNLELIGKHIVDFWYQFLVSMSWALQLRHYRWKQIENRWFRSNAVSLTQQFQVKGTSPPIIFAQMVRPM